MVQRVNIQQGLLKSRSVVDQGDAAFSPVILSVFTGSSSCLNLIGVKHNGNLTSVFYHLLVHSRFDTELTRLNKKCFSFLLFFSLKVKVVEMC